MSRELLQKCLARMYGHFWADDLCAEIRAALAQPAPEPVAWAMLRADGLVLDVICPDEHNDVYEGAYTVPLYAAPAAPAVPDDAALREINSALCTKSNGYVADNARLSERVKVLEDALHGLMGAAAVPSADRWESALAAARAALEATK